MALEIFKLVGSVFVDTDKADKSLQKTDKKASGFGKTLGNGIKAAGKFAASAVAMGAAAVTALGAIAESTREYRTEQGKLQAAFETNGFAAKDAKATYTELNGVLGDSGQAVEASNHLAKLCNNAAELADWTNICTGVFATFGDSLPIEGLTEAANETAKVGQVTGPLADALNWAGVSEDAFNESLAACTNEQERQALITETLNGLYSEAADKYREVNGDVIAANKAQEKLTAALAAVGKAVEPVMTAVKGFGASLLEDLVPGVEKAGEAIKGMLGGKEGAAEELGASLSGIITTALDKIVGILPQVSSVAFSLISTLSTTLVKNAPQILKVLVDIVTEAIQMLGQLLPELLPVVMTALLDIVDLLVDSTPTLVQALVDMINGLVKALPGLLKQLTDQLPAILTSLFQEALPSILDSLVDLVATLCEQLPIIVPQLMDALFMLVELLVEQIPVIIPQLVEALITLVELLAEALPELIPQLVTGLIAIVELLIEQLPVIIPMLIDACVTVVMAIIEALPDILVALTQALPGLLQAVWDAIVMVFLNLPAWFGQLFAAAVEIIFGVFGVLGDWAAGIWESIQNAFAPVGQWFSDLFSGAWEGIQTAWSGVTSFFSGIWESIQNAFGSVADWFGGVFSAAWEAVKNVFSATGEVFLNIGTGILEALKIVVNAIIRGLNTVIALPFDGLNGILSTIQGVNFLGISPFSWLSWRAPVPQIPELEEGAVLEKGQVGLLEGNGAEAVVPLERNQAWTRAVARDMDAAIGGTSSGVLEALLTDILEAIEALAEAGVYLDTDALVGGLAKPLDRKLGQIQAAKARA